MNGSKFNPFLRFLLLANTMALYAQAHIGAIPRGTPPYPTHTLAGVTVIDTPIVREAQELARQYSSDAVYFHVVRSWLFGALMVQHNETLAKTVDLEIHAVAAILHDLGWDEGSPFISPDRRFEVDGAVAAVNFIRNRTEDQQNWDHRRTQLVWDSIALHTQPPIADYKEIEVQVVSKGVFLDFAGPDYGISNEEYQGVLDAFPRDTFRDEFNKTVVWLCQTKPSTTYDTFMQPWGDNFVANYSAVGHRAFDLLLNVKPGI